MKYIINRAGRSVEISEATSSVLVYRIPYQNLAKDVDEPIKISNKFIVYILFGENKKGLDVIYVGKSTNGLKNRPTSHEDKYDNWTYCYVMTQFEERTFFNDGTIQYIEDKVCKRINEVKHYRNTTKLTNSGTANRYDIEDCTAYLNKAYEMLDALGLDLITYYESGEEKSDIVEEDVTSNIIPDGIYYMSWRLKRWENKEARASMQVAAGKNIVLTGSDVCPNEGYGLLDYVKIRRDNAEILDDKLQSDVVFDSISAAASFVVGASANGWSTWKTEKGEAVDIFRKK